MGEAMDAAWLPRMIGAATFPTCTTEAPALRPAHASDRAAKAAKDNLFIMFVLVSFYIELKIHYSGPRSDVYEPKGERQGVL
jgi:hypothetical protein